MFTFLAATFFATQQSVSSKTLGVGLTAWVFSTVGQSEWCPAGNVLLDVRTGRYALTPRAPRGVCNNPKLERSTKHGTLAREQLASVRLAYARALTEGLQSPACRSGPPVRPDDLVIINGGVRVLVVTSGSGTGSAPDELTCWSKAASALKDLLDRTFSPGDYGTRH